MNAIARDTLTLITVSIVAWAPASACGQGGSGGAATSSSATADGGGGATTTGAPSTSGTSTGPSFACETTQPGPLPGWERDFDGITCAHPAVLPDCTSGWCRLPPGCFIMGSPEDEPGHPAYVENQRAVTLTRPFWMKQHEVTQGEWAALGLVNPSGPFSSGEDGDCTDDPQCPVGRVNWWEALAYANLLSEAHAPPFASCYELSGCTGTVGIDFLCEASNPRAETVYDCDGYRLPTSAEFEYAIRAGTTTAFFFGPFGEDVPTGLAQCDPYEALYCHAWYCGNSGRRTSPVGLKRPNAWHLYDMAGNAAEWVDHIDKGLPPPPGPLTDPSGPEPPGQRRLVRAGEMIAWPTLLRSASGLGSTHSFRSPGVGFRLARTIPTDPARAGEGP